MSARNKQRKDFDFGAGRIIGHSEELHKIFKLVEMVAKTEATVLIQGDSGTGKELIANAIHYTSLRAHAPFIKINCAALPENLLESELFGYKKGAFTGAYKDKKGMFEMADGGTLLLDEIGNMSLSGQIKLLRVLQEGEIVPLGDSRTVPVDVRVLVTTNIYLAEAVKRCEFREDLFYRLQVVTFEMPPLRALKMDIPLLVDHFIYKQSKKHHRTIKGIAPAALEILMNYDWPGNIRELEHSVERAIIMEHTDIIQPYSLSTDLFQKGEGEKKRTPDNLTLREKVSLYERQQILRALNEAGWKKNLAARKLGIDQRNLNYFLKKHHITDPITRLKQRGTVS